MRNVKRFKTDPIVFLQLIELFTYIVVKIVINRNSIIALHNLVARRIKMGRLPTLNKRIFRTLLSF